MSERKTLGIGLIGCGNIGQSFVDLFEERRQVLSDRIGVDLRLAGIAVADATKPRRGAAQGFSLTSDLFKVVNDPQVDVVVELIGGTDAAREGVMAALRNGKSVITGNKELIAGYGEELFAEADRSRADLLFESAAAAAIPLQVPLRESLLGDEIHKVVGILNGTSNFILSRMSHLGEEFGTAMAVAQNLGIAEPDPSKDVSGADSASKLVILASLAFKRRVAFESIVTQGIGGLRPLDHGVAADMGMAIKPLAMAELFPGLDGRGLAVRAQVSPAMIPRDHPLGSIADELNAVMVQARDSGQLVFSGAGAGRRPTSAAILGDVIKAAVNIVDGIHRRVPVVGPVLPTSTVDPVRAFYVSLDLADTLGALAESTRLFADHGVSLDTVRQSHPDAATAHVFLTTHPTQESAVHAALAVLRSCHLVRQVGTCLPILDDLSAQQDHTATGRPDEQPGENR